MTIEEFVGDDERLKGKRYDEMTPEEQAGLSRMLRNFYRGRPEITARLIWIPRFLNGYAEHKRQNPNSELTRAELLGLVIAAGFREWYPPPTRSSFELGRQADRVIRLGLESLKDDSGLIQFDYDNLELIRTMCADIEGYEFLRRIGAIDAGSLGRKRS